MTLPIPEGIERPDQAAMAGPEPCFFRSFARIQVATRQAPVLPIGGRPGRADQDQVIVFQGQDQDEISVGDDAAE